MNNQKKSGPMGKGSEPKNGSDFEAEFFTAEENKLFRQLLGRLRTFEAAVCSQFRQMENEISKRTNETSTHLGTMERSINETNASGEIGNFEREEKIAKLEGEIDNLGDKWAEYKENAQRELSELSIKMEKNFNETKSSIDGVKLKLESVENELKKSIDVVETRVEFLEMENASDEDMWIDNGHEDANFTDGNVEKNGGEDEEMDESEDKNNEEMEDESWENEGNKDKSCELMMADPFFMNVAPPGVYDGNPAMPFSRWYEKFKDLLLLCPQLNEEQKLSRLRICLAGQARGELDSMSPAPETLQAAIDHLKRKFENENTKSIARQAMSICKQAPGEKVYEFANRLNEAVRTVLAGETQGVIQKRLLEEFLDRLTPDLQFEVKSGMPTDYSRAYELAQHFELLLAARRSTQVSVAELTNKVETLTIQQQNFNRQRVFPEKRTCFYCRRPGHLARECRKKKKDEAGQGRERQNYYNNGPRRNDNRNWESGSRDWRGDNQNNRNFYRPPTPMGRNHPERENYRQNNHNEDRGRYNNRSRSPRVQFGGRRMASARIASPILLALIAICAIFGNVGASETGVKPMICLPDAPTTFWTLPTDPICPNWAPMEIPITFKLHVYRPNTVQYKTEATACSCVKSEITRKKGFFGGLYEKINTQTIEISTAICEKMKDGTESPAGNLENLNGTLKATNNSLEIGWGTWPMNLFWRTEEVTNCYVYKTVVFTRHGMEGLNTPLEECPMCVYKTGACKCTRSSLIWTPEPTQQCSFIWLANWMGEYSSLIWTAEEGDFALSFENISSHSQPECYPHPGELIVSDQSFAVQAWEYREMIEKATEQEVLRRDKRETVEIGPVYSSQLAAQLTALSAKMAQTTQRLFVQTVRKICTTIQIMADQVQTMAVSNPTLLARFLLGNTFLSAKLITDKMLEIKPCFPVYEGDMHFNWQKGHCFEFLPVTFHIYKEKKHGFIDPVTMIIHPNSREIGCDRGRFIYLKIWGLLIQYDQKTGDVKQIPDEGLRELARNSKIDAPEIHFPTFKNKVLSNFTEIYSPENFRETIEGAKIIHEISRLTKLDSWQNSNEHTDRVTGGIVANGLFSFLRGGILSMNQVWVFSCCCYVTFIALTHFLLPLSFLKILKFLNIGRLIVGFAQFIFNRPRRGKNGQKQIKGTREEMIKTHLNVPATANVPKIVVNEQRFQWSKSVPKNALPKTVPLTQRWPSPIQTNKSEKVKTISGKISTRQKAAKIGEGPSTSKAQENRENVKGPVVLVAMIDKATKCDEKFRVPAKVNGKIVTVLLDTGAHVSLCCMEVARKLGITKLYPTEVVGVVGIGDKMVPIIGQCEIVLELAGYTTITILSIIEKEIGRGSYDLILGRNSFKKLPFLLDLEEGFLVRKNDQRMMMCNSTERVVRNEQFGNFFEKSELNDPVAITEVIKCLKENEKVFSCNEYDLGTCHVTAPTLLTTSEVPVRAKPYPVPEKYEQELKAHIEKMLEVGVIKESCTPWVHNIVLVKKANGQLRPCVDFRPLNKVTIVDPYPLPRMDKVIYKVAGKKWYSTLDLSSGFWQIPLDAESSYKCGIITPWGLYQMLKLPFGLRNAPSIFQRTMDKILEGLENVTVYIDDILVHTNTLNEHLECLNNVFIRLQQNGLKHKGEKCKFYQRKCVYLGHILSEIGYQPSLTNREVIENFPVPKNVKEVKRFLGMVSFFRKFIPNFASIAFPLNRLTRDGQEKIEWGEDEEAAMRELKSNLLKSPCLRAPDYKLAFYLFTDASAIAYGAALMQSTNGVEMHAVAFWSRTLSATESKLPPTHGELAAIVNAIQHFRPILYGAELIVLTDHRPLTFLFQKASVNPKLNRWLMALQEFEPKVIYLEGRANKVADALSRVPITWECVEIQLKEEVPYLLALEEGDLDRVKFEKETKNDPILAKVMVKIKENWAEPIGEELKTFYQNRDSLYLEGNIIRKYPQGQIVVPEILKIHVLKIIHKAHFGIVRSKAKARRHVWWPKISEEVEEFVKECAICQRNAPAPPRAQPNYKWPEAMFPFERVHVDLAGPIWGTNFLVMVDAYSKFPFVFQINSTNTTTLIWSFREIFAIFGSPRTLVSDNGPQFISAELKEFLGNEGVKHITSPAYHPQSNGEAERFVRTFKEIMQKLLDEGKPIKLAQFIFVQEYRSSPCPALEGESPAQKFLKREIRTEMDKIKMKGLQTEKEPLSETPHENMPSANEQRNKRVRQSAQLDPGDSVWVRDHPTKKWAPGVLLDPIGERMWRVELEGGGEKVAHEDQIKGRRIAVRH